tara:strand:+ start:1647 stop:1871 length:225 start_codon:yes stop_codon:yes gene_type:complete
MGIVVTKANIYKSIPMDTSDKFTSINIPSHPYKNGVPVVNKDAVHRNHFRRVLSTPSRGGIPSGGNAKEVPTAT